MILANLLESSLFIALLVVFTLISYASLRLLWDRFIADFGSDCRSPQIAQIELKNGLKVKMLIARKGATPTLVHAQALDRRYRILTPDETIAARKECNNAGYRWKYVISRDRDGNFQWMSLDRWNLPPTPISTSHDIEDAMILVTKQNTIILQSADRVIIEAAA